MKSDSKHALAAKPGAGIPDLQNRLLFHVELTVTKKRTMLQIIFLLFKKHVAANACKYFQNFI